MNIDELQERTIRLLGTDSVARLRQAHVVVLGTGGVGAFAAEELARAGIGHLTLIDGDQVEYSNFNRQLPALMGNLGRPKAEVLVERFKAINPFAEFQAEVKFLTPAEAAALAERKFDCAVDAIDDVPAKCAFLAACVAQKRPVISAMGAGGKIQPELIRYADISKTYGCPLARVVRKNLRDLGIKHGVGVVFSPEPRRHLAPEGFGTISYMPALFGGFCAAAAIKLLLPEDAQA